MRKFFLEDESGATLVEYGIALIVAIVVGGTALINMAGEVNTNLSDACGITSGVSQIGASAANTTNTC